MEFRDCTSLNSTENIQRTLKNDSRIKKMETTIIYINYVITSVLVSSNCQDPVWLHDHSSDTSCKMWWLSISEIDSSVSSVRKKYCIASMFIITRAVSTPRDVEIRESGSMFCETIEIISWSSYESSRKHENIALKSTMTKQWSSLIQQ